MGSVYYFLTLPAIVMVLGGWLASFWQPSKTLISNVQHVAAGIILAAITIEVFPEMRQSTASPQALVGMFAFGVLFMFGVQRLGSWLEARAANTAPGSNSAQLNYGLVITVFLDAALDGVTIGAGFAAGEKVGFALAIGLSAEMLFLGMSLVSEAIQGRRVLWVCVALAATLLTTALVGYRSLSALPASTVAVVLAFSAAALLYLVTEELLVEAHVHEEKPYSMLVLFAGFVGFWVITLF
ncbi:zinc permease [Ralstonia insidiosa]|jgi:ZIP family zinc transporter|uniref:Zinc permease n=4 Tax=Burkholderiaceae TaxID=119060 RepID=A0AAW4QBP7_RALPI|nr:MULTISPECIES: zinc permease [Burkholderiales]RYP55949.1 hypothetical protein DL771_012247 [Monosporascus sp. 5C6A]BCZ16592.1 ZIP family metal transporter [Comamonas testosteroni]EFP63780.1 metal cation transporter, ZIP family [Ralstonia pickettii]EGY59625.1 hypothetical protein HMPREF0989_04870 [Ralstonia sp. 5_2_56FAA]MBA9848715.1 zinc permease [Ralstonia pickettii]